MRSAATDVATVGPGRPRSPEADRAILAATQELLAERGYAATTVEAIARRAQASKATLYRRWPSKAHLAVEALALSPPLRARPRAGLEDDLLALLREFLRLARETPLGAVLPSLLVERARDPELRRVLDPLVRERVRPFEEAVARAVERGELPAPPDLRLAVQLLLGPVLVGLFFGDGRSDARAVRTAVRAAVAGLRAVGTANRQGKGGTR